MSLALKEPYEIGSLHSLSNTTSKHGLQVEGNSSSCKQHYQWKIRRDHEVRNHKPLKFEYVKR